MQSYVHGASADSFTNDTTVQQVTLADTSEPVFDPAVEEVNMITGKRPGRAVSELLVTQLVPWSMNYFVRNAPFARISPSSIFSNMQPRSWEWDDNKFQTNQFAHPFHGSLYYNAFRSNGYNFWQSAPAAISGSLFWEVYGETHPPAPNDLINTSLGGIALGEMTHRMAHALIDEHARGFKRTTQELLALIINPVNGLNRILDGKWGRVNRLAPKKDTTSSLLNTTIDYGGRFFSERTSDFFKVRGNNEFYVRLKIHYGDVAKTSNIPFHQFNVVAEFGAADSAYINMITVNAYIKKWHLGGRNGNQHMGAISMNYDFMKNSAFEFGAQSFRFSVLSKWKTKRPNQQLRTEFGASVIALGAVPDVYLYYGEGRNYDYGPGLGMLASSQLQLGKSFYYGVQYRGAAFKTLNGNRSSFLLNIVTSEVRFMPKPNFYLGIEFGHFTLNGYYRDYADIHRTYPFFRYSTGFTL